jgi:glycosyltransferase involved in cell wall biosynthesis
VRDHAAENLMRLLYYADARSPIARSWVEHFIRAGHQVHWISSYPAGPLDGLASFQVVPVAFSAGAGEPVEGQPSASARGLHLRLAARHWLGPLTVGAAVDRVRTILHEVRPDLVHAMRIPFEGMVAAQASGGWPLLISTWGNDFTLHGPASPAMSILTRRAVAAAGGLHTDCRRDLGLASRWGFGSGRPTIVLPGNGGVRREVFFPDEHTGVQMPDRVSAALAGVPRTAPIVVNPRGFRAYVRNDTFFRAIPRVLDRMPGVVFACPAMAGEAQAERWSRRLRVADSVRLLPPLDAAEMAGLFRRAQVSVSPSTHDGTPNTLLEAMACGCFPIAGDLEPIREWLMRGETGLIIDPADEEGLAWAILRALEDEGLRQAAARRNVEVIRQRADYPTCMRQAEAFYRQVIEAGPVL